MAGVSPASDAADADGDPDVAALEDLLGPPKRRVPRDAARASRPEDAAPSSDASGRDGDAPDHAPPRETPADGTTDPEVGSRADEAATQGGGGAETEDRNGAATNRGRPGATARAGADGAAQPREAPPDAPGGAARPLDHAPAARDVGQGVLEAERLPASASLAAMEPAMGLADTLRNDRVVTVPARGWPRAAAAAVAALAAVLWVLALRSAALGAPWPALGLPASWWLFLLALAGGAASFVAGRVWPEREIRLHLEPSQQAQFQRLERDVERLGRAMVAGVAGAVGGVLVLGLAYLLGPAPWAIAVGTLLTGLGAVVAGAAAARRRPTRLLYVQTLVLQRLESMGLGRELALDPRTAEVILALDRLLGQLPESSLRQFLSRPEAQWYLELIQKLKEGRGGG